MAKGKKYRKWYEKHKEEIQKNGGHRKKSVNTYNGVACMPVEVVETGELIRGNGLEHPVHGYFVYECEECGAVYQMYLDKGLEDKLQDRYYPDKHKPVPFMIGCRNCGKGYCKHILWGIGDSETYEELPEGESYFKNDPNEPCGVAVCNKSYHSKAHWMAIESKKLFCSGRFA